MNAVKSIPVLRAHFITKNNRNENKVKNIERLRYNEKEPIAQTLNV